jgi:hydroxylamine reductase (hybrid-cluster protein)
MNKTADEDKDDIDIYEESSFSESQTVPGAPQEGDDAQDDKEMKDRIIKTEEKAVRNARLLVIAAVIACAVAVSTAIYIFASNSDQSTFEMEVSNNRHIHCCSIVISTSDALTVISTSYLMTSHAL